MVNEPAAFGNQTKHGTSDIQSDQGSSGISRDRGILGNCFAYLIPFTCLYQIVSKISIR